MATKRSHRSTGEEGDHRPADRLNKSLCMMLDEVGNHLGTDEGRRTLDRLAIILARPAQRIARAELEKILPRDQVGINEIDHVARAALVQLCRKSSQCRPGMQVIPWFATIVRSCAREFARHHSAA